MYFNPLPLKDGAIHESADCVPVNTAAALDHVPVPLPTGTGRRKGRSILIRDSGKNADTHNIIVSGNGKKIEGADTKTINAKRGLLWVMWCEAGDEWIILLSRGLA